MSSYNDFSIDLSSLGLPFERDLDVLNLSEISKLGDMKVVTEDIKSFTSIEAITKSIKYRSTFVDRPGIPPKCDKYTMFQVFFDDNFTQTEYTFLKDRFSDFSRKFLTQEFLKAIMPLGTGPVKAPRNKKLPLISGMPAPQNWNENTTFYVIFAGIMTNYLPECEDRRGWPLPRFIPIFTKRYTKPQDSDGFWEYAYAPINRLNETRTCEIAFNATAMSNAGGSDIGWTSTILHEIMHNGGWEHPDGYTDRTQYVLAVQDAFEKL